MTGTAATLPTRAIVAEGGKPEDYATQGLLVTGTEPALDLGVRDGALGGDETFAASAYLAEQYGWSVGDQVEVWLADGHQVHLRLAAVYERARLRRPGAASAAGRRPRSNGAREYGGGALRRR